MLDGAVGVDPVRRQTFLTVLAEHGHREPADHVVTGPPTVAAGAAAIRDLLSRHPDVTAVFAFNDLLAIGAVRGAAYRTTSRWSAMTTSRWLRCSTRR